jgi:hypothetical protein
MPRSRFIFIRGYLQNLLRRQVHGHEPEQRQDENRKKDPKKNGPSLI